MNLQSIVPHSEKLRRQVNVNGSTLVTGVLDSQNERRRYTPNVDVPSSRRGGATSAVVIRNNLRTNSGSNPARGREQNAVHVPVGDVHGIKLPRNRDGTGSQTRQSIQRHLDTRSRRVVDQASRGLPAVRELVLRASSDCRGGDRLWSADSVRPSHASSSGQLSDNRSSRSNAGAGDSLANGDRTGRHRRHSQRRSCD